MSIFLLKGKTPGRAYYSTRCFVVLPNTFPTKKSKVHSSASYVGKIILLIFLKPLDIFRNRDYTVNNIWQQKTRPRRSSFTAKFLDGL